MLERSFVDKKLKGKSLDDVSAGLSDELSRCGGNPLPDFEPISLDLEENGKEMDGSDTDTD